MQAYKHSDKPDQIVLDAEDLVLLLLGTTIHGGDVEVKVTKMSKKRFLKSLRKCNALLS